jgi:tetratricopeptide (TPR) repeat protein
VTSIHDFISREINISEECKCIIFAGAGVSFNSGIPTVPLILSEFINEMPIPDADKKKYLSSNYPFEGFISTVKNQIEIDDFLEIFKAKHPNTNHEFVALLAKHKLLTSIYTTNFDTLFESALIEKGVNFNKVYSSNQFKTINKKSVSEGLRLIKLHGCIEHKKEIGITFQKIACKENIAELNKILQDVFINNANLPIIFLGYSFSDHFDIVPLIKKYSQKTTSNIIVVDHSTKRGLCEIETISLNSSNNPFSKCIKGWRIKCNTDEFIEALWRKHFKDYPKRKIFESSNWKEIIKAFIENKIGNEEVLLAISARLMLNIYSYKEAQSYFFRILNSSSPNKKLLAYINSTLGNLCNRHTKDYNQAIIHYKRAIILRAEIKDLKGLAEEYSAIATCFLFKKQYRKALLSIRKAIKIRKDNRLKASHYSFTSIGNVYFKQKKNRLALLYYFKAHRLAAKNGDLRAQIYTLINSGVVLGRLSKFNEAQEKLEAGYEIAKVFCDYGMMLSARFYILKILKKESPDSSLIPLYTNEAFELSKLLENEGVQRRIEKL